MSQLSKQKANYSLELRCYPTSKQIEYLSKCFGVARWIFNYGLNKNIKQYKKDKIFIWYNSLAKDLPKLKKNEDTAWLKEVDSVLIQQSLKNLDSALSEMCKSKKGKRKGKQIGFPKFKSKSNKQSFKCVNINNNIKVDLENNTLKIPKLKSKLKIVADKRRPIGKISSITLKKTPTGKYFVSILYVYEKEFNSYIADQNKSIGIDFGLKDFITLSNGEKIKSPQYLRQNLKRLKHLSHSHSKKKANSKNREKARFKLAKLHEKITNQRKDFNHKLSRQLINQYDFIFVEDLNIETMKKIWGRKISDISWHQFVSFLTYKALNENKYVLKIDRYFPSSRLCFSCGFKNTNLTLKDREWKCPVCGEIHDRDLNASLNVLNEGKNKYFNIRTDYPEFKLVENGVQYSNIFSYSMKQEINLTKIYN